MKHRHLKIGFFSAAVLAAFWLAWDFSRIPGNIAVVRGREFRVELAETEKERSLGLGERDSLCESCAMLFVFPEKRKHSFWMKGMRFPLDILWFEGASGKIVHIEKNIPPDSEEVFAPSEEADRVLEINGGLIERFGIQVGDEIRFLQ